MGGPVSIEFDVKTYDPALLVLGAKGYSVRLEAREDHHAYWHAAKEGHRFAATNPVELLGVVALWEARGENWPRQQGEASVYEELLEGKLP